MIAINKTTQEINKLHPAKNQQGQALILIAVGIFTIITLIGFSLDAAHAFADRRQAQNASDAAAMSAAIALVSGQNFNDAAMLQIRNNGYLKYGQNSNVEVHNPPVDGPYSCAKHPSCNEYVQVTLTSTIDTWLASIIGINTLTNKVSSVARAESSRKEPFYGGNAIIALNPNACSAVEFTGSSSSTITGSGVYVNSGCNEKPESSPKKAFYSSGAGYVQSPWVKVVGGAYYKNGTISLDVPIATGSASLPDIKDAYVMPKPECGAVGAVDPLDPTIALPGKYTDFPPDGVTSMEPGLYCVDELKIQNDLVGENVLIVLSGGVRMNGNAYISLKGRTQGEYEGLLMYMVQSHMQQITINGNSASEFSGTILAPRSHITINGTGKSGNFVTQIIADTVTLSGDSDLFIEYNENKIYHATTLARIELAK